MIRVIEVNDPRVLDYSIFPEQNPMNYQFIRNNMMNFSDSLTDTGRRFMEMHQQVYSAIDHNEIARKARQASRETQDLFRPDVIVPLESLEQLRGAQLTMQRYLMAHTGIRTLYHANRADGFNDTYIDMEPNRIGENHTDYRKVMSGAVEVQDDGSWICRQYFDELPDGDQALDHDQKYLVRKAWDLMDVQIQNGDDPTNPYGGELGF